MNAQKLTQYEPIVLGIVRIVTGLLFLEHGAQKFLSFPPGAYAGSGWAFAQLGAYAGPIELICGFLIALGLFTSIAAFLASGEMAVAFFKVHLPNGWHPLVNHGEAAVLFCFGFLYMAARGSGRYSVDGARAGTARRI